MKTFAIYPFDTLDLDRIDKRLLPFVKNWKAVELYKNKTVTIPNTWDSKFTILNYFQVYKSIDDPNPGEDENEIGMTIVGGWHPYDTEVIINLRISGKDVLDNINYKVSAEILKSAGAPITLYHNDKLITDFTQKRFWCKVKKDKIWISELKV